MYKKITGVPVNEDYDKDKNEVREKLIQARMTFANYHTHLVGKKEEYQSLKR
jgi:hypothetical protein